MLKHYLTEVKAVLHEVPLSVIYFLLVNVPLFSLSCFFLCFFLYIFDIFSCTVYFSIQKD